MGDPLTIIGAVGACAGLADLCFKICKSLNQMRGDFADAAESLEAVSSAVESFGSVLEQIGLQLDKGRAKGLEYDVRARLGLRNILDSCTTPLVNLQKILSKFSDFRDLEGKGKSSGIKVIMMRLRWMLEENRIVKIQKSVAQQKSTLQTQLLLVLIKDGDSIKETIQMALQNVSNSAREAIQDLPPATSDEIAVAVPALQEAVSMPSTPQNLDTPTALVQTAPSRSKSRTPGSNRIPLRPSITSIFSAIQAGNNDMLLQVLQGGVTITDHASDGTTPLVSAVVHNREEIVLTLLFFRADSNAEGGYYGSPLRAAINLGRPRLVKILLQAGANPAGPGVLVTAARHSVEMLQLCLARYDGFNYPVNINAFYDECGRGVNEETPLCAACNKGRHDVARFLLEEAGADAAAMFKGQCIPRCRSALHAAIVRQDETLVVLILSHLPDPNVLNDPQYEPGLLHCAVDTGNLAVLKLLVEGKVALNTSFPLKGTALQVACARGNVEMVRFLLHHKADPVVEVPDLHGGYYHRSPLHIAADSGSVAIVEELLAHGTDPKRNPGILWVAARGGSTEVMSRLLDVPGVDINEVGGPDNYGDIRGTALHCAAGSGNLSMLKLLLDEGADPNLRTPFLGSPYDVAIKAGHQDCVTELRDG